MLASISPLGERARGNRWSLTAAAYAAGAVVGGAVLGCALGGISVVLPSGRFDLWLAAAAALAAGAFDLLRPARLPTLRRQVDEDWLGRYRGWVYGAGFGLQLGVGLATVVTTATVFAWMAAALLAHSLWVGVVAGSAFGAARAVELAVVRDVNDPRRLRERLRLVASGARRAALGAAAASVAVGAGCALTAIGAAR